MNFLPQAKTYIYSCFASLLDRTTLLRMPLSHCTAGARVVLAERKHHVKHPWNLQVANLQRCASTTNHKRLLRQARCGTQITVAQAYLHPCILCREKALKRFFCSFAFFWALPKPAKGLGPLDTYARVVTNDSLPLSSQV